MPEHRLYNVVDRNGRVIYRRVLPPDANGIYRFASGYGFLTADLLARRGYTLQAEGTR